MNNLVLDDYALADKFIECVSIANKERSKEQVIFYIGQAFAFMTLVTTETLFEHKVKQVEEARDTLTMLCNKYEIINAII